jgi:hypothetical protein
LRGPPEAVTVSVLEQAELPPLTVVVGQVKLETTAEPSAVPVPLSAVPAPAEPLATLAVSVTLRVPVAAGEKVIVPKLQEDPLVNDAFAQDPAATANSLAFAPLRVIGVALRTTAPLLAVIVAVPVQEAEKPAAAEQLTPITPTEAVP